MREQRATTDRRRAREFEAFAAGAAGRLLHVCALLTGEPPDAVPRAERLLTDALAATYADWDRLRGEDPYHRARQELAVRFAQRAWHRRPAKDGVLGALGPRERLVLVLRLYEGLDETQTGALTGLPPDRVRVLCARAAATLRDAARAARGYNGPGGRRSPGADGVPPVAATQTGGSAGPALPAARDGTPESSTLEFNSAPPTGDPGSGHANSASNQGGPGTAADNFPQKMASPVTPLTGSRPDSASASRPALPKAAGRGGALRTATAFP